MVQFVACGMPDGLIFKVGRWSVILFNDVCKKNVITSAKMPISF